MSNTHPVRARYGLSTACHQYRRRTEAIQHFQPALASLIDSPSKENLLLEGGGFAMIYGPDAKPLCSPLPETGEGPLYAEIDLGSIGVAKAAYDPAGHYSRPDVVRLLFNKKPSAQVQVLESEDGF